MAKTKKPATKIDDELAKMVAEETLRPSINAAAVIVEYAKPLGKQDIMLLADALDNSLIKLRNGDLSECEEMLMVQAQSLQTLFMNFSRRALAQEYQRNFESFIRMAMKAQNQCRMTLETLAMIRSPTIVYARQANIAAGHQQINNGTPIPSRAQEIKSEQTQLSGELNELLPDTRASGEESRVDSALETLGEINRAEIPRG